MSHTRFALGFTRNRKVFALSDSAFRLWVSAIDYAREQRTDGLVLDSDMDAIPRSPARGKRRQGLVSELLASGLWEASGAGWKIHDFLHWQDSAEQVAARQERARERMRSVRANIERTQGEVRTKFDLHASTSFSNSSSGSPEGEAGEGREPDPPKPKKPREISKKLVSWPSNFDQEIRPRVLAWGSENGYPAWWLTERLEAMHRGCLSKNLRFVDWFLAATNWLRRDDQDYGNGPAALEARRVKNGTQPASDSPPYHHRILR